MTLENLSIITAIIAMSLGLHRIWMRYKHTTGWHNPGLSVRDQVELEMLGGSHNPRCRNLDCAGCQ